MANGLEDVVAAETVLSDVDGLAGRLIIRGRTLAEISGHWSFEEVVALLFDGFFADLPAGEDLVRAIGAARCEVFERIGSSLDRLAPIPIYDGVRAGLAMMPDDETMETALRLLAAPAVLTAALLRRQAGTNPIAPNAAAGHAVDMLRMMGRDDTDGLIAGALDAYLVTVSDHGLNASTFAARVVASTHAGLTSSALAGMSALKGPLHGGAPGPSSRCSTTSRARARQGPGWSAKCAPAAA